jgi:hypothetical protein
MKKTLTIVCGLALATAAIAQQGPNQERQGRGPHGPGPGHGFPPPVMVLLDVDKDGVLSMDEILAAPVTLAKLETNGDRFLTADEICAGIGMNRENCPVGGPGKGQGPGKGMGKGKGKGQGMGMGGPGGTPFFLQLLDIDKNGALSAEEVANAAVVLMALDRNNDDQLTPDELKPRDGRGAGGPRGPGAQAGAQGPQGQEGQQGPKGPRGPGAR